MYRWSIELEGIFVLPLAPRWFRHSYLSKEATIDPLYLWVITYRKTGLHRILFISTVDPLQPPRATVHPPSTSSSLHLRLSIHGLLFIQPPPRATPPAIVQPALHRHPSTVYCSSSPPLATVQPGLHGVLFIHPQPTRSGSCSSSGNGLYYHGVLFIQPPSPASGTTVSAIGDMQLCEPLK